MSPAESVLVDIAGLVIRGRSDDVPRRLRRMLNGPAQRRGDALSETCRTMLLTLLSQVDDPGRRRRARSATAPPAEVAIEPGGDAVRDSSQWWDDEEAPAAKPFLSSTIAQQIEGVLREHRRADELADRGLTPTSTVLLSGPPGVGKSMTAAWMAAELNRPLARIEPATTMGSMLGESARSLSEQLRAARDAGAVVLLDEIDALAKRRDDPLEVGEYKRLVSTLLMELDRWPAEHLLVAATNHPDLLDPALERRFELSLHLGLPGDEQRRAMLADALSGFGSDLPPSTLSAATELLRDANGAAVARVARSAARASVLDGVPAEWALIQACLPRDASRIPRSAKAHFAQVASAKAGMTSREIAPMLQVSHTTVQKLIRSAEGLD